MPQLLLIKIGAIGDCVMALHAARACIRQNPGIRLTWVIGAAKAALVRSYLPEAELILVDEAAFYSGGWVARIGCIAKISLRLLGRRFDRIAIGYRDRRYGAFALFCRGPRFWFLPAIGQWHVAEYFRLLMGSGETGVILEQSPLPMGSGGIAIAPGGAKNELRDDALRRMNLRQYRWIAEHEISRGHLVSVIGAPTDEWVKEGFEGLPVRFDFSSRPLLEFYEGLKKYDRLYTHDSGPMHLAILAGIPVTAFFGPTRPDEKVPMNDPRVQVIYGNRSVACQPCYDGKNYAVCSQNKCLEWSKDEFFKLCFDHHHSLR